MKKFFFFPILGLLFIILFFFHSFLLQGKLPIPADTIVGLYHPFRDLYAREYPNGIPYKNFLITDPVRQQYPWRFLAISLEKNGKLPLWNPYSFAGTPLLANFQTAAFYPLNLFLFIFPFSYGWSMLILFEQILAGIFMYLYLSNLRLHYFARFLGSLSFAFCGFMTAWLEWGTLDHIVLWMPLLLLSIDKVVSGMKYQGVSNKYKIIVIWSLVFTISLICSFLAGHLQPFSYVFIITLAYFIARWIQFGRSIQSFILFLVLLFCFVILTSFQWIPTLQFILQSARNADQLNAWKQNGWFIPWQNLIQFIAPDFFGNPATLNYWGIWNYGEFIGYIGIFPLIMAIFALFYRHDKKTLFFGTFFFLSLIFSLPTIFAKLPYLFQIPFIDSSQPTRLLLVTDFSLTILGALGFDYFIKIKNKKQIIYPTIFLLMIFIGAWAFVLLGTKLTSLSSEFLSVAKRNLYFPTVVFILSMIFLFVAIVTKNKQMKMILLICLLFIAIIDLFRFSDKFIPFTNKAYLFPSTTALNYLQKKPGQFRIMTTDSEILPPNFSIMYHLQSLDGYDPLYLQRYGELIAAIMRNKPDIHAPFGFNRIITPTNISSRLIDLFGVQYVLSLTDQHEAKLVKVFSEGQMQIYKNMRAFPRVFFVHSIKVAKTKNAAIDLMFRPTINLHTTAIIEGWDQHKVKFGDASATVLSYQENTIIILTKSTNEAFLVLTDAFYPTWHVTIDGKDAKMYRTDYLFRGVVLTPGNHRVIFSDSLL